MKASLFRFLFLLIFAASFSFAWTQQEARETVLTEQNVSWQTVLSGKVISKPAVTSYGFAVITDARMIHAVRNDGTLLWEQPVPKDKSARIFTLPADFFILLFDDGFEMRLLNPSGKVLWEKQLDFSCENIFSGRDGRFFAAGNNHISCYGINGIRKWTLIAENLNAAVFYEDENKNIIMPQLSGSSFYRFSPFGHSEIISDFVPEKDDDKSVDKLCKNNQMNLSPDDIVLFSEFSYGVFVSTLKKSYFFNNSGLLEKTFTLPENYQNDSGWNYLVFTSDYHLVVCRNNWNLDSYKILQKNPETVMKKNFNSFAYENFLNLEDYYSDLKIDDEVIDENRLVELRNGDYGENECFYSSQALNVLKNYEEQVSSREFGTGVEYSLYESELNRFGKVINQISLFSTVDFINICSQYIKNSKNPSILQLSLIQVAKNGYDPDGNILKAIEICARNLNSSQDNLIIKLCDAIYSLCSFMGRPAYNSKGRQLLAGFVSTYSSEKVRNYARKTLGKIKALEL